MAQTRRRAICPKCKSTNMSLDNSIDSFECGDCGEYTTYEDVFHPQQKSKSEPMFLPDELDEVKFPCLDSLENGHMDFGAALASLKLGMRVARSGWNGKNMYLYLVNSSEFEVNRKPLLQILEEGTVVKYRAHIDMRTAQGDFVPWVASQSDLLADDWFVLDGNEQAG